MSEAAPRLARSAGLFGLATMASRILGLVRDTVLAYYFGAGDAMDAFRVAFRVPNLVRDLFAEGAMSAAFVPTFTRELTAEGKPRAWQLANSVITALADPHRRPRGRRHRRRRAARPLLRPAIQRGAGQDRAHGADGADHGPVPHARGARGGVHGHAELARALFRARALAGDVQRRGDRHRDHRRADCDASRVSADRADGDRDARRWVRSARHPVAAAAGGGVSLSPHAQLAGSRARPGAPADGTGNGRHGGDADQRPRQHAVRHEPGHGCGLVARLRVSAHVPADWPVRRVDRRGVDAGALEARRHQRSRRACARRSARRSA